ncbi:MAG TPA: response regulator, partial [Terracidiphilus sp.]|nr:response regulator [Terracidiphilus sp.]
MTTEPTQPQVESGPTPANGQGQSQGHRRRRRRRKNKSSQSAAPQVQQSQPIQALPPQAAPPPRPPQQQQGGQGHQGQGQARSRKKKKFFTKGSSPGVPQPGPGNSIVPQGRRKERQKGPRAFVGPMDHSYRVANGNVADGPQSTIPTSGNGHSSGYYPDVYAGTPAAPIRENAPTRIFCFIEDLFFLAKIQETARKLGVKVEFVKGDKEVVERIMETPETERPTL